MHKLIAILTLIISLTSCLTPQYSRPPVDVPPAWRFDADESSTFCNFRWWEQFQDPVLNEMILLALRNNQDLQVAISRVFEYYAKLGVTSAALWPEIDGTVSYNRSEFSIAIPLDQTAKDVISRVNNDYEAFFNLSWELDLWGRVRSATQASYAELLSQVEARRGIIITVVTSVANAYIRLRELDAQLIISKETLKSRLESLKLAQDRFMLGETSEIEVKQAESEVEVAAIRVIEFEREIPKQENLLSILLGENPHDIERGLTISSFQYPCTIPAGLPSDLLERRPDIVQAENLLIAANARITQARALFFPQISLTGMYGSQSSTLKAFLTNPAEMWQYGFTAVQTIFDAGRIRYLVKEAQAVRDEALYTYRQTILNAFREVNDALIDTEKNQELVIEHQRQVKVLGDYLHLAKLRYEEGEIDYLNVLDAERSLFNAQLDAVQAQAENFGAVVQLYGALGGGWVTDADIIAIQSTCD